MAKHTPGPWALDEVRTSIGRAFRIGAGEMLQAGKGCCIIYDDYPGNPDNERSANARLIAAAPDLLTALKGLRDECSGTPRPWILVDLLTTAAEAIAKAEGK